MKAELDELRAVLEDLRAHLGLARDHAASNRAWVCRGFIVDAQSDATRLRSVIANLEIAEQDDTVQNLATVPIDMGPGVGSSEVRAPKRDLSALRPPGGKFRKGDLVSVSSQPGVVKQQHDALSVAVEIIGGKGLPLGYTANYNPADVRFFERPKPKPRAKKKTPPGPKKTAKKATKSKEATTDGR